MKQLLKITLCLLLASLFILLSGCNSPEVPDEVTSDTLPAETESTTAPPECEHNYVEAETVAPMALKDGEKKFVCSLCNAERSESIPATKSLKVLALGNSFTVDGMQYLWDICKDAGVEEIVLGNLYIGGCTLDTHWGNIKSNAEAYTFYKNTDGTWETTKNYTVLDAIKQEEWDYFVFHQNGSGGGFPDSYSHLGEIISYFNENKTNPDTKMYWHMGWAYQSDSTHDTFVRYDRDQMKMYNMTVDTVKQVIVPNENIVEIIPSGTAIQNLRTSYLGDNLTRDGYHMNYGFGRYTLGLVWCVKLTGGSIDAVDYVPPKYADVEILLPVLKEAANAAIAEPFKITNSVSFTSAQYPVAEKVSLNPSDQPKLQDYYDSDKALAAGFGYDLSKYKLLEWDYKVNAYWNCASSVSTTTPKSSASTYNQNICVDKMYSIKDELPLGTIVIVDPGWRVRFEIFPTAKSKYTGTRPEGLTAPLYVLSDTLVNDCQYIAWSISTYPKTDISEYYHLAYAHVRIYVPTN